MILASYKSSPSGNFTTSPTIWSRSFAASIILIFLHSVQKTRAHILCERTWCLSMKKHGVHHTSINKWRQNLLIKTIGERQTVATVSTLSRTQRTCIGNRKQNNFEAEFPGTRNSQPLCVASHRGSVPYILTRHSIGWGHHCGAGGEFKLHHAIEEKFDTVHHIIWNLSYRNRTSRN